MKTRWTLALLAGLAVAMPGKRALAQSAPDGKAAPSPDSPADKLIVQLGDDDYQKREEAQRKLVALGKQALPALQRAEKESRDAEVRARAHDAIAAILKDAPGAQAPTREKRGEVDPDEPKLDDDGEDQPRVIPIPRPRMPDIFRGNRDLDGELPEAIRKMIEQFQKQFEGLDRQAQRELRRPMPDRGTVRTEITIRPKTPVELRLGVALVPPAPALANQLQLGADGGLVVDDLTPNQPAWRIGLQRYDVVVSCDGKPVRNPGDLADLGTREAKLEVVRQAKRQTILVHPLDPSAPPPTQEKPADGDAPKGDEPIRKF